VKQVSAGVAFVVVAVLSAVAAKFVDIEPFADTDVDNTVVIL
jgi:hypothetical protein